MDYLHEKAKIGDFKGEVLTTDLLNEKDEHGDTVWHTAASYGSLKDIPSSLFNIDSLNIKNSFNSTVWHLLATGYEQFQHIPLLCFTDALLDMKSRSKSRPSDDLFGSLQKQIITSKLNQKAKINDFLLQTPSLAKEVEFADDRLVLSEFVEQAIVFKFDGIDDKVILNKHGAFVGKSMHKSLNDAVLFIEHTYPDTEKSIFLPSSPSSLGSFIL